MRNDKLIPGTILVIIGILFLMDNFGLIHFSWSNFFHLWPIILVIAGVNLVFSHNRSGVATAIKIIVLIVGLGFLIFSGLRRHQYDNNWDFGFNRHYDYNDSDTTDDNDDDEMDGDSIVKVEGNGHYQEAYKPEIKLARLNITGGGTSYTLKDATNNLFEADTKEYSDRYVLTSSVDSATQTLDFDMNNKHHHGIHFNFGGNKANKAYIKLNNNPEWEIRVQTGATKLDFDLTNFKIRKLKLEGGAASFHVKMGQPLAESRVEVSTGVSEVSLNVPQNAACRITTETGLSSKSITGFQNTGENEYETPGFDKAANKMYIKLSGGISDFKVKQY
ncbi:LiaI-LiaF-like domain-containing protein [Mucilaginibacter paludis]|uniref:LiaI-LiaF-like transmembrane region domain-containing protein n=1 Tax=Mucilaginibacter paludis DSM 18603 TaxID=714943 RepID=H1YF36_9SPHI|nr:DUF5668 domain-containing protein [Mucilaginibacter paludis]EHQ25289.1 hypothetical protein Mucpa_1121 [Mucilaginibacter paludis DSM 18603]